MPRVEAAVGHVFHSLAHPHNPGGQQCKKGISLCVATFLINACNINCFIAVHLEINNGQALFVLDSRKTQLQTFP